MVSSTAEDARLRRNSAAWAMAAVLLAGCSATSTWTTSSCAGTGISVDSSGRIVTATASHLVSPNSDLLRNVKQWPGPAGGSLLFATQQYVVTPAGQYLYIAPDSLAGNARAPLGITRIDLRSGESSPLQSGTPSGSSDASTMLATDSRGTLYSFDASGLPANQKSKHELYSRALPQLNGRSIAAFAVDDDGAFYFAVPREHKILTYRSGTFGAIGGPASKLLSPSGVAVSTSGDVYVADAGKKSVAVFAHGASGNVPPVRVIAGPATALTAPGAVALDGRGNLYVLDSASLGSSDAQHVRIFSAAAAGNARPLADVAFSTLCAK